MGKRIGAMVLMLALLVTMAVSCNDKADTGSKNVLTIEFFKGGLGDEWLNKMMEEFKKEHKDVEFKITGDADITAKMGPKLEAGANLPDLAFVLQTSWQGWAVKGYLEDLSGLYQEEVDGASIYDKLQEGDRDYGKINGKYWVMPWNDGVSGLVYNSKMFAENGWEIPGTVSELKALTVKIREKGIAPFAWGGKVAAYWGFPVTGWWAQYQGAAGIEEYKAMAGPEVYAQEGRLKALEVFEQLVTEENSVPGAAGMDHIQSQMAFVQGKAAMIPNGVWIENEMRNSMPDGFEMKMMPLPAIDGAKDTNINYTTSGDFIIVPAKAKNKELAKEFIQFMSRDDMLKLYTQTCGSPRPFKYDVSSLTGLTPFTKSALDIWGGSKNIYIFSSNPIHYSKMFEWPFSGPPFMAIYVGDDTAKSAFENNANFAKENWSKVAKDLGLS